MATTESATIIAKLPAQLLYIAAQFAEGKKGHRDTLKTVKASRLADARLRIEATNGHHAFRCTFALSEGFGLGVDALIISAEAFRKRIAGASIASFDLNGMAVATDAAGGIKGAVEWRSDYEPESYPKTEHVWPDSHQYRNTPGGSVAFNAGYAADFMKQAAAYGVNGAVRLDLISPNAPMRFLCDADIAGLGVVELQYLLMPVQVRG